MTTRQKVASASKDRPHIKAKAITKKRKLGNTTRIKTKDNQIEATQEPTRKKKVE